MAGNDRFAVSVYRPACLADRPCAAVPSGAIAASVATNPGVGRSETFALSSRVLVLTGAQLAEAGVKPSAQRDRSIDNGVQGWQDWFRLNWGNPDHWVATTRKVKDPLWRGPQGARLAFEINPANDTVLYVSMTRN